MNEIEERTKQSDISLLLDSDRSYSELPRVELRKRISELSVSERRDLLKQTERILDRHAEVQENQRNQATRILQGYFGLIGISLTALPFVISFIKSITISGSVGSISGFAGGIGTMVGSVFLSTVPGRIYPIMTPAVEVLSPDPLEKGPVTKFSNSLSQLTNWGEDARAGVRSVSLTEELEYSFADTNTEFAVNLLIDRIKRIEANEAVINHNTEKLSDIYQQTIEALEYLALGSFLLVIGLTALGASV